MSFDNYTISIIVTSLMIDSKYDLRCLCFYGLHDVQAYL